MPLVATGDQVTFATVAAEGIPNRAMTPVRLSPAEPLSPHVHYGGDGVVFDTDGWYEVLLRVDWDPTDTAGTRFSHTKIPGQEPLHSEAISAAVLLQLSEGRQLLRGNSLFGPDRTTSLVLEVWHDCGRTLDVRYAELVIRELMVPWTEG